MKKIIIALIALTTITTAVAVAKPIDLAIRPNFGYRHVSIYIWDADQLVFGGTAEVIFNDFAKGYMSVKPGFEISFMDNLTVFNINLPVGVRYPMHSFTPFAHMGMAIAYGKGGNDSETELKFMLGGGCDIRVGPNFTIGPQIETYHFEAVDIEAVASFFL